MSTKGCLALKARSPQNKENKKTNNSLHARQELIREYKQKALLMYKNNYTIFLNYFFNFSKNVATQKNNKAPHKMFYFSLILLYMQKKNFAWKKIIRPCLSATHLCHLSHLVVSQVAVSRHKHQGGATWPMCLLNSYRLKCRVALAAC